MKSPLRYIIAGAMALTLTTATVFADSPTPKEAQQAAQQLKKSNKSLLDIIQAAQDRTGGTAIAVALVNGQCKSEHAMMSGDHSAMNKLATTNGRNQKVCKTGKGLEYRVTCLLSDSTLKDVYVCANTCKVKGVCMPKPMKTSAIQVPAQTSVSSTASASQTGNSNSQAGIHTIYDNDPSNHFPAYAQNTSNQNAEPFGDYTSRYNESARNTNDLQNQPDRMVLGSKILEARATNDDDQNLGEVKEVVINPDDDRVVYTEVSTGGIFGLGERHYAVPCDDVDRVADGRVYYDVNKSQFNDDDGFKENEWPIAADTNLERNPQDLDTVAPMDIKRLSQVIGQELRSRDDENVGRIDDAVIDTTAGRVAYLIVDRSDSNRKVAVPTFAIRMEDNDCVLDNMTKSRFDQLRSFTHDNYPQWTDAAWNQRVFSEFGMQTARRAQANTNALTNNRKAS